MAKGGGFQVGNQQRSRENLLDRRTRNALWRQRKNREYYNGKGLLPPSELTEGGRRIYTEANAAKLRRIMVLKSLGLKLADNDDTQGHLHALRYKGLVRRSLERKATSLIGDRNARRAACHQANCPL